MAEPINISTHKGSSWRRKPQCCYGRTRCCEEGTEGSLSGAGGTTMQPLAPSAKSRVRAEPGTLQYTPVCLRGLLSTLQSPRPSAQRTLFMGGLRNQRLVLLTEGSGVRALCTLCSGAARRPGTGGVTDPAFINAHKTQ